MSNVVSIDRKNSFSSLGDQNDDAMKFKPRSVLHGDRFRELDMRESYYACIAHGELVVLGDGREVPIEGVLEGDRVQALKGLKHLSSALVSAAVRTGRKEVARLVLRSGRVVRATWNHRFKAATSSGFDWRPLRELRPGDHVAVPRTLTIGDAEDWSVTEARALGFLIGDGHCGRGYFGFTQKTSLEVTESFARVLQDLGWECVTSKTARWQMRAKGNGVAKFLERTGQAHRRSWEKFVPASLFACNEDVIAAFVGALWDCDGSVNHLNNVALLSTTSALLARDLQSLLLRLGIWSKMAEIPQSKGFSGSRPFIHRVTVSGEAVRVFARKVPLAHVEKLTRLGNIPDTQLRRRVGDQSDVVPSAWGSLTRKYSPKTLGRSAPSGNISREKLLLAAERDGNDVLHALATSDVRWDRIESVDDDGEEWVYDLTVPKSGSFIASGMYVHNCSQHDAKIYDFDGRVIGGTKATQPLISTEKSPIYIPMKMRRPSAPYRMGKIIVDSFTNLLFGENRFPHLRVNGDETTQDFVQTISRVARLPMQMIRARCLGGSMGTVGLSWCFHHGTPRFEVHNAKNLYVHSWLDRVQLLPRHVTEVYLFYKVKWDGKAFNKVFYWFRRDWTPEGDFVFTDVPFVQGKEPNWEVDEELSNHHGDGVVHFEWIQNFPTDEIDGLPDYDGLYEQFDVLDVLNSVVTRGAILNLDPTLKIKMDRDEVNRFGLRKGSDNALITGKDGDASYMELSGTSIEAGLKLVESLRRSILETAQAIVPDPSEVASQGVSSVTIKALFTPMLAKADVLREQYSSPMKRALENMTEVARRKIMAPVDQQLLSEQGEPMVDPQTGQPITEPVQFVLNIPPRYEKQPQQQPAVDPMTGQPQMQPAAPDPMTGMPPVDAYGQPLMEPVMEVIVVEVPVPRMPGQGGELEPQWPPYFAPTFADQTALVAAMQIAAGGKPFISVETATDVVSAAFGVDPVQEKKRLADQGQTDGAAQAAMFPPGAGGEVTEPNQLPDAAQRMGPRGPIQPTPVQTNESPPFVPETPEG